jgi:hypothetical protein
MADLHPHRVSILWGSAPEVGDRAKTYSFATKAELDAFKLGVAEMDGWMGWREIEAGFEVTEENVDDIEEVEFVA